MEGSEIMYSQLYPLHFKTYAMGINYIYTVIMNVLLFHCGRGLTLDVWRLNVIFWRLKSAPALRGSIK